MRIALGVALATMGLCGTSAAVSRDAVGLEGGEHLSYGWVPPPFTARDLTGQARALADYRGSILVLHFWASWCPFCRGEIEELIALHRDGPTQGVQVLTVSVDEDLEKLRQFVTRAGLPYPVIADLEAHSSIADRYEIAGIPVTCIIAPDGRLVARLEGASDIRAAVQAALR